MRRTQPRTRTRPAGGALLLALAAVTLQPPSLNAQISQAELAERRAALASELDQGLVLAMGSTEPPQDYISFHQNSPFRYLTGFREPNAALVMIVEGGEVLSQTLFVDPRNPAEETWEGYRVGPEGAEDATGIRGRSVEELPAAVDSLIRAGWTEFEIVGPYEPQAMVAGDVTQRIDALLEGRTEVVARPINDVVAELREIKSEAELGLIRQATEITSEAHRELMGAIRPEMNEFEIQALAEYTFRRYGSERPAFASIVASGSNSTVLHYNANDRFTEDGDLMKVDIGASYGGYAADITRTFPVNGRFSEEQRQIYRLVRDAQRMAEEAAGPGVSVQQMSQAAVGVIAEGLADLGLIEAPNATFQNEDGQQLPQFFLYYMHALGHGIGLDVHDPWPSVLAPGTAFTIEPGVYVRPNLLTEVIPDIPQNRSLRQAIESAFERYVGIGVRIEDDYIITENGLERISSAPREIEEIEALMARPWDGPRERNSQWVEWYREVR